MKYFTSFVIVFFCFLFLIPQDNLVEKVDVDWWVVPLFAVDKSGDSVTDLKKCDIQLLVNGKNVPEFLLMKRHFSVLDSGTEEKSKENFVEKEKIAFLIFDIAYSSKTNREKSKAVAADLISKSASSTRFVLMTVDPFVGLQYIFGPSGDKSILKKLIDRKVIMLPDSRNPLKVIMNAKKAQIVGRKGRKYGTDGRGRNEMSFHVSEVATILINANKNFFFSFESLYYSLNQIRDNKFIFFFSEGLSALAAKIATHRIGEFYKNLQKSAQYLGRSGSVIFIVDPSVPLNSGSGSDSLKTLAIESGGKYMRGTKANVSKRFEKMNRAYYELAFSSGETFKGKPLNIEIKPIREKVKIHSLRTLEKRKQYNDMNSIEKEVLVLNLLERNKYFRSPVKMTGFEILKKKNKKEFTELKIELPGKLKRKYIDIYFVYNDPENKIEVSIETERKNISGNMINLQIKNDQPENVKIVMIDEKNNTAYIDGLIDVQHRVMKNLLSQEEKFDAQVEQMSDASKEKLKIILEGASFYSNKLENAVFHFVCKEQINESVKMIARKHKYQYRDKFDPRSSKEIRRPIPGEEEKYVVKRIVGKYEYDYQLLQSKGEIKEKRQPITKGKSFDEKGRSSLRVESFITRKIAMTPLAIFDILSQTKFKFRMIKSEKLNGLDVAVLEVFPKDINTADSVYGKVWIDKGDNSIMKIDVNPVSIGG
ncbi:MAG: hypothetical protein KAR14_15110, partial [Candidatus Aminicenantes bacterium]|nr:hypothetical protein [Candidatus Aminicenantes bacterium]